jgi:hypothetical protein
MLSLVWDDASRAAEHSHEKDRVRLPDQPSWVRLKSLEPVGEIILGWSPPNSGTSVTPGSPCWGRAFPEHTLEAGSAGTEEMILVLG